MPGKYKGFGIVRDKNGKPRFDNINNIQPEHWSMLTANEQQQINEERNQNIQPSKNA